VFIFDWAFKNTPKTKEKKNKTRNTDTAGPSQQTGPHLRVMSGFFEIFFFPQLGMCQD
jgi:hypothetical protein